LLIAPLLNTDVTIRALNDLAAKIASILSSGLFSLNGSNPSGKISLVTPLLADCATSLSVYNIYYQTQLQ